MKKTDGKWIVIRNQKRYEVCSINNNNLQKIEVMLNATVYLMLERITEYVTHGKEYRTRISLSQIQQWQDADVYCILRTF